MSKSTSPSEKMSCVDSFFSHLMHKIRRNMSETERENEKKIRRRRRRRKEKKTRKENEIL